MVLTLEMIIILIIVALAMIYFVFDIIKQFIKRETCCCNKTVGGYCYKEIKDYFKKK
jgi:competence protein ComGC